MRNNKRLTLNKGSSIAQDTGCSQCMRKPLCMAHTLEDNSLHAFSALVSHARPVKRKQALFRAGDRFDRLYFVRAGLFKSYRLHEDGALHVTGFHLPGEMMGLDNMNNGVHSEYLEALDTGSVCELPLAAIEKLARVDGALVMQLMRTVSAEVSREKDMMYLLGKMGAKQKLANFLIDLSDRSYTSGLHRNKIHFGMTRADIANHLGMAVETISRILQGLRDQGILTINHRDIELTHRDLLESIAKHGSIMPIPHRDRASA